MAHRHAHVVTTYRWPAFDRMGESADHVFLVAPTAAVVIVPKRGIQSRDDVDRFKALASTSIGSD